VQEAKDFMRQHVSENKDAASQLTGCVVYGDFLKLAGSAVKMPVLLPAAGQRRSADAIHGKEKKRHSALDRNLAEIDARPHCE